MEITEDGEVVAHCRYVGEYKEGSSYYAYFPYVLVMDENCTKLFTLEGELKFKEL